MARGARGRGWHVFYMVTQVFVALWIVALALGVIGGSSRGIAVPAINLVIWSGLLLWAKSHQPPTADR